jgi:hypothetical protein
MTWADFYLICFAVGFLFSLLSFLAGGLRWHLHLPHFSHVHVAPPQSAAAHGAPANSLSAGPADGGKAVVHHPAAHLSPFNFVTLTAFLAWFGGTGYLLTRFSGFWFVTGLSLAVFSGLVGGAIVFLFLSRVLISQEENGAPVAPAAKTETPSPKERKWWSRVTRKALPSCAHGRKSQAKKIRCRRERPRSCSRAKNAGRE